MSLLSRCSVPRSNTCGASPLGTTRELALVYYEAERYEEADAIFAEALGEIDRDSEDNWIEVTKQ